MIIAGGNGPEPRTSISRPLLVAVTWMSSGLPIPDQGLGQRPRGFQRARERGIEDRTAVDRHDVVRAGGGKADLQHVMGAKPRMHGDAAAAGAVRIDQRRHLAVEPGLPQRLDDDVALPGAITVDLPMLDRAAAADAEMRAERLDPFRARRRDRKQSPAVRMMPRYIIDLDGLAAERVGHVDGLDAAKRDAVAAMADMVDLQFLNHVARRGRIRCCRRRP